MDHPANDRTRGIAALLEGYFAAMWFGWAQADPPPWLVAPLTVASVLAACIAVAAVVVTIRAHGQHTPMRNPAVGRTYLSSSVSSRRAGAPEPGCWPRLA